MNQNSIYYVTRGHNVKKDNINIKCPFCGVNDPSQHMGIDLKSGWWGCWRDRLHRGKKPHRLIKHLLGCSWSYANEIAIENNFVEHFSLSELQDKLNTPVTKVRSIDSFKTLPEFKDIKKNGVRGAFFDYLKSRGFSDKEIPYVIRNYQLKCCLVGTWQHRLILPLLYKKKLVGWVGREIRKSSYRYRVHPKGDQAKRFLFNYDKGALGGRLLFIVEGPFDCLKVDFYGRKAGCRAIATMGLNILETQIYHIMNLSRKYDKVVIMLDQEALKASLELKSQLSLIDPSIYFLEEAKDPGDLKREQVLDIIEKF